VAIREIRGSNLRADSALRIVDSATMFGQGRGVNCPFVVNSFLQKLSVVVVVLSAAQMSAKCEVPPSASAIPESRSEAPPQDRGLPYTRSARAAGLARIKNSVAVFAGSRFGYVKGFKVRLDEADFRSEAVLKDGQIYVPQAFASVLDLKKVAPTPAPDYLADRWVYTLEMAISGTGNPAVPARNAESIDIAGKPYVSLAALAVAKGLKVFQSPLGLLVVGEKDAGLAKCDSVQLDTVVTLFDTPEKFADPDIATRSIPNLKRQGKWTERIKAAPEQVEALAGPETQWPCTPKSAYDLTGFNTALLGSKVPAPGVYPRLLFSPEDVPVLAERHRSQRFGQMSLIEMETLLKRSWWDPKTSDGQIFEKLARGDTTGLEFEPGDPARPWEPKHVFKGQKPGIYSTHVDYVPQCLTSIALYCLLTDDNERGRQTANAVAAYYKLREPFIDRQRQFSASEIGSSIETAGDAELQRRRSFHPGQHMDLAFALDFAGKWMTPEQRDSMRRIIAKLTYGGRSFGQDGPVRMRDNNSMTLGLTQFLAATAIEGLEGFDREVYESGMESARAFCEWGIDEHGQIFEGNGTNGPGLQFQLLSMIVLARRGENLWGHPHFRNLLQAQAQCTSPNGWLTLSGGAFSSSALSLQAVAEIKAFYPEDRCADYLLSVAGSSRSTDKTTDEVVRRWYLPFFHPPTYPGLIAKLPLLRLPGPTYPLLARGVVYDTDWSYVVRNALKLQLDYSDPVQGVFSVRSDDSNDAAWMAMIVSSNHYLGRGEHHSDAGLFHFSALGVNWFTESAFVAAADGKFHNHVLVDGTSMPEKFPARAAWLGATIGRDASSASADLTYAYSWQWNAQPDAASEIRLPKTNWELEPAPAILRIFAGTERYKMRSTGPTYTYSGFTPTARVPFNPMRYVYRSVALVRGDHPYGVIVDDVRKDDREHLYQWTAMLAPGVWRADVAGLEVNQLALACDPSAKEVTASGEKPPLIPGAIEPILIVTVLSPGGSGDAVLPLIATETLKGPDEPGKPAQTYDRLTVTKRGTDAAFRILLTPFRSEPALTMPEISGGQSEAAQKFGEHTDRLRFKEGPDHRTRVEITRDGSAVLLSGSAN